jgi:hypothetical protein
MSAAALFLLLASRAGTPYTATSATPGEANFGAGYTIFNRSFSLTNGATLNSVGVYSASAGSMEIKIALRNSATSYTVVANYTVAHGGAGWQDFALSPSYTVPASGTYYVGVYQNIGTISSVAAQTRAYVVGDPTSTNNSMTEDTGSAPGVRVTGTT